MGKEIDWSERHRQERMDKGYRSALRQAKRLRSVLYRCPICGSGKLRIACRRRERDHGFDFLIDCDECGLHVFSDTVPNYKHAPPRLNLAAVSAVALRLAGKPVVRPDFSNVWWTTQWAWANPPRTAAGDPLVG